MFPAGVLTELISRGAGAGLPAVLTTTSAQAAEKLADHVNAVVIHRMTDPVMAERFARIAGEKLVPSEAVDSVAGQAPAAQARPGSAALGSEPRVTGRGVPGGDPPGFGAPGFGVPGFAAPGFGPAGSGAPGFAAHGAGDLVTPRRPVPSCPPAAPRSCAGPWCHQRPCVAWATASSSCWSRPRGGGSCRSGKTVRAGCTRPRARRHGAAPPCDRRTPPRARGRSQCACASAAAVRDQWWPSRSGR